MNVLLKVQASDAAKIAHSIMAYDVGSDELDLQLPIPFFLDTLALKIAEVPPDDKYGALSYKIKAGAVQAFRFLLGLDVDLVKREYFLEGTMGRATSFAPRKFEAVELLTQVTPHPRYARAEKPRISERELVLPTLRLLDEADAGRLATAEIVAALTTLFAPSGQDAEILVGRHDTYLSQKIRNMISHRDQPWSFIQRGLARYERHGLEISDQGRKTVSALLS